MKNYFLYQILFLLVYFLSNQYCVAQTGTISNEPYQVYLNDTAETHFGERIWSGGDVNGDGFQDVIVWRRNYFDYEPFIYLFYGTEDGFSPIIAWSFLLTTNTDIVVDITGDYNNDGYEDILLGCHDKSASCFYGSAAGPNISPDWIKLTELIQVDSQFGTDLTNAGDVNNDGYDDALVSARLYDNGQENEGMIFLYKGTPAGLSTTATWNKEGNIAGLALGSDVSGLGDINGDGYDDVSVSAFTLAYSGKVYVYKGIASGISTSLLWSATGASEEYLGEDVGAGDFNGDGFKDLVACGQGTIRVYNGNGISFSATPTFIYHDNEANLPFSIGNVNNDAFDDLLFLNYLTGWIGCTGPYESSGYDAALLMGTSGGLYQEPVWTTDILPENCPSYYGAAFTDDVNGDGFQDFYLSDAEHDVSGINSEEGAMYLFLGGDFELPVIPAWEYSKESNTYSYRTGYLSDLRGDINGDGFDDLLLGRRYIYGVEVFWGDTDLFTMTYDQQILEAAVPEAMDCSGDFNNDGYNDCLVGSPVSDFGAANDDDGTTYLFLGAAAGINISSSWTAGGIASFDKFGTGLANIGDLNGDGFDDAAVGMPYRDGGNTDEGAIRIYLGNAGGLNSTPLMTLEGEQDFAYFGAEITAAGDVNNDGFDDMLIGIPDFDVSCSDDGVAFVYFGSVDGFTEYPNWVYFGDDCGDKYGFAVAGNMDINSDGFDDILIGSPYAYVNASNDGRADIFLGSPNGPGEFPDLMFNGETIGDNFGYVVAGAGDFNADGYDDFAIGSPQYNYGSSPQGMVMIYYGKHNAEGIITHARRIYRATHNTEYACYISGGGDVNGDGSSDFGVGEKEYSNESGDNVNHGMMHVYLGIPATCSITSSFSVTAITEISATISWTADADAMDFAFRWKPTGAATWNYVYPGMPTVILTGLSACTNYQFEVQVNCSDGSSAWSATQLFTTSCAPPCSSAPTGLFANNITTTSAKLNWSPVVGATKYKISYKATASPTWINLNSLTTTKNISGLTPGTNYQFKVKAICPGTSTPFSPNSFFTTLLRQELHSSNNTVSVYPNPTNGIFTIAGDALVSSNVLVKVAALSGAIVFQSEHNYENSIRVNLQNLPAGCYALVVQSEDFNHHTMLIIQ